MAFATEAFVPCFKHICEKHLYWCGFNLIGIRTNSLHRQHAIRNKQLSNMFVWISEKANSPDTLTFLSCHLIRVRMHLPPFRLRWTQIPSFIEVETKLPCLCPWVPSSCHPWDNFWKSVDYLEARMQVLQLRSHETFENTVDKQQWRKSPSFCSLLRFFQSSLFS